MSCVTEVENAAAETDDDPGEARRRVVAALTLPVRAPVIVVDRLLGAAAVVLIGIYKKGISPFLTPSCRFAPSCSQYTRKAILRFGFFRGGMLGAVRIARCHPFHPGGFDPVPRRFTLRRRVDSGHAHLTTEECCS